MKHLNILTIFFLISNCLLSADCSDSEGIVLNGIVLFQNSGGMPVEGVEISSLNGGTDFSKTNGFFKLCFTDKEPGDRIELIIGGTNGKGEEIEWVNYKELQWVTLPNKNNEYLIKIIVCDKGERDKRIAEYHNFNVELPIKKIEATFQKQLNPIKAKLDSLNLNSNEQTVSLKIELLKQNINDITIEKNRKLAEAHQKIELYKKQALKDAEYIASINKDQSLSYVNDALSSIENKEDINAILEKLNDDEIENDYIKFSKDKLKFNNDVYKVVEAYRLKLNAYKALFDFKTALKYYEKIIEIYDDNKIQTPEAGNFYRDYAMFLLDNFYDIKATFYLRKSAEILKKEGSYISLLNSFVSESQLYINNEKNIIDSLEYVMRKFISSTKKEENLKFILKEFETEEGIDTVLMFISSVEILVPYFFDVLREFGNQNFFKSKPSKRYIKAKNKLSVKFDEEIKQYNLTFEDLEELSCFKTYLNSITITLEDLVTKKNNRFDDNISFAVRTYEESSCDDFFQSLGQIYLLTAKAYHYKGEKDKSTIYLYKSINFLSDYDITKYGKHSFIDIYEFASDFYLESWNNIDSSIFYQQKIIYILENHFDEYDPLNIEHYWHLSSLYYQKFDFENAIGNLNKALKISIFIYGENHNKTKSIENDLYWFKSDYSAYTLKNKNYELLEKLICNYNGFDTLPKKEANFKVAKEIVDRIMAQSKKDVTGHSQDLELYIEELVNGYYSQGDSLFIEKEELSKPLIFLGNTFLASTKIDEAKNVFSLYDELYSIEISEYKPNLQMKKALSIEKIPYIDGLELYDSADSLYSRKVIVDDSEIFVNSMLNWYRYYCVLKNKEKAIHYLNEINTRTKFDINILMKSEMSKFLKGEKRFRFIRKEFKNSIYRKEIWWPNYYYDVIEDFEEMISN